MSKQSYIQSDADRVLISAVETLASMAKEEAEIAAVRSTRRYMNQIFFLGISVGGALSAVLTMTIEMVMFWFGLM